MLSTFDSSYRTRIYETLIIPIGGLVSEYFHFIDDNIFSREYCSFLIYIPKWWSAGARKRWNNKSAVEKFITFRLGSNNEFRLT